MRRPPSYSESDIRLPRISTIERPILQESPTRKAHSAVSLFEMGELSAEGELPSTTETETKLVTRGGRICSVVGEWSFRFLFHLTLISLFETVFFWYFVSPSEDAALVGLVDNYLGGLLDYCATLSSTDKALLTTYLNALVNRTEVDILGLDASIARGYYNSSLQGRSSFYFLALLSLTALIGGSLRVCRVQVRWCHVVAENVGLIAFLAAYEAMFFSTVAFQYQPITAAELDRIIVDELFDALTSA